MQNEEQWRTFMLLPKNLTLTVSKSIYLSRACVFGDISKQQAISQSASRQWAICIYVLIGGLRLKPHQGCFHQIVFAFREPIPHNSARGGSGFWQVRLLTRKTFWAYEENLSWVMAWHVSHNYSLKGDCEFPYRVVTWPLWLCNWKGT